MRGFLEQVPMMREETFCDMCLLVSIIKSIVYMPYCQPCFQKDVHDKERRVKLNTELSQMSC